jgi:N6-adenosine-specific RNA methylase IME4
MTPKKWGEKMTHMPENNTDARLRWPIASIRVGDRHRKDLGDIASLARSIAEIGLLHPIVIRPDGALIAGGRRLAACTMLGWVDIPVTVVDLENIIRGELAENTERKDFLPSEIEAIRRALLPVEVPAARDRMIEGARVGKVSTPSRTRDRIGAFAGVSGRTVEKIAAVVAAAEAQPERFGKLAADMDRTGKVNGPYARLRVAKQAEVIRAEPPPLPGNGPYRVASVDPPWPYDINAPDPMLRATHPYPQMPITAICALDVPSIMAPDSIVWLWTTNYHLVTGGALEVLRAWDFKPKTILTWVKDRAGRGDWLRGQTEQCILAVRGSPIVQLTDQTTVLYAPVRDNSQKPDEFYQFVEKLCPAPRYAELFARSIRPGWDAHGDEIKPRAMTAAAAAE